MNSESFTESESQTVKHERSNTMKKILSFVLILTFMLTVPLHAVAAYTNGLSSSKVPILKLATVTASTDVKAAAAEYLEIFRTNDDYEILGFTAEQFYGMQIGNPFLVYQFDTDGRNLIADIDTVVYTCPMVYGGKIIGVVAAYYNEETEQYSFAAYRDTKYENLSSGTVDTSKNLIVGNMDSTLFVTDGTNVDILGIVGEKQTDLVNKQYIQRLSTTLKTAAGSNFVAANDVSQSPLPQVQLNAASAQTRDVESIILNVPYVAQDGGICGCASWASILNYRFQTSYDTASLTQAMIDAAFITDTDPIPSLTDYRDFTNQEYPTAGCVWVGSPPSFSSVRNLIINDRPIRGSWWRYKDDALQNEDNKVYHSINIIGYRQILTSYYNYYLVNPWFNYVAMIYVADSSNAVCDDSVVFPEGWSSRVWHLNAYVY